MLDNVYAIRDIIMQSIKIIVKFVIYHVKLAWKEPTHPAHPVIFLNKDLYLEQLVRVILDIMIIPEYAKPVIQRATHVQVKIQVIAKHVGLLKIEFSSKQAIHVNAN